MPSNHLILCHSLQSFPASGSFQMSRLFASRGQSIGASASASVLPMNIQGWFPSGLTGLISLQSKELSRVFSSTTIGKHQFFSAQPSLWSNSYICLYMTKGKTTTLTIWTFIAKVKALLFSMLSTFLSFFGCGHCSQWSWSPREENLSLSPLFPLLFAMKWWHWMPWS